MSWLVLSVKGSKRVITNNTNNPNKGMNIVEWYNYTDSIRLALLTAPGSTDGDPGMAVARKFELELKLINTTPS
ncbi:hypothetical protein NDU88_004428 [Pleurodeles waltl]|uniref:Uncharacterized protein n=1 Tax=Pleurodeles waltl TaxID=8319 RepID=A0AAV7UF54_PLEWA|nr:hypothetical protein NDU88_004428 [Pleurodeles waltl]